MESEFDRKRAGETAVGTERELQQLIDNIPVQVATFGIDGNYVYVNKRSFAVTGFSAADLQGEHWKKLHHPDEVESIEREWSACLDRKSARLNSRHVALSRI